MKTMVLVVVAALTAGCVSGARPVARDYGVCLEHGIIEPQRCEAWLYSEEAYTNHWQKTGR